MKEYISIVTRGIAPIVPHTAEEAWLISGEEGFVLNQPFPEGHEPDLTLVTGEDLVKQTLEDTRAILNIAGIDNPKEIVFIVAPEWKWNAIHTAETNGADGKAVPTASPILGLIPGER